MAKLADAIREYFTAKMSENKFLAWAAEYEGKIIASSGLWFHEKPPIHRNLTGREAYFMNMYTLPDWRNKGIATKLLKKIIKFIKETNVRRIRLHATEAGKKVYEKMGVCFGLIRNDIRLLRKTSHQYFIMVLYWKGLDY